MCDWNNNGKYDMEDAFINYHIHRSVSRNNQRQSSSPEDTQAVIVFVAIILLVLGIFIIFS